MIRLGLAAVAALLLPVHIAGAQNQQTPLRIAASTFGSVEVHINARRIGTQWIEEDASLTGPSRIAITYGRARDVGRIPLTSRTVAEPEESLTIYLVPESARPAQGYAELRGILRIKWGRTELSTTWRVAS